MKILGVWKSIDVCTIVWVCIVLGIESLDTWFGTLYLMYGLEPSISCMVWVWKLLTSFLVRGELRRALRLL